MRLTQDAFADHCYRHGHNSHHRSVRSIVTNTVTFLNGYTGIHGRAIAYPTPYDPDITPEQQLTAVNPIISLMGKV